MSDRPIPTGVSSARSDATGVEIVRVIDAPREPIYEAWTDADRFASWFGEPGPSGAPSGSVTFDPRVGGAWHATVLDRDGTEISFSGEFRELDPPSAIETTFVDARTLDVEPDVLRVELRDLGDGRTEMRLTVRGERPSDTYSRALSGSLNATDRLAALLERELKAHHDTDDPSAGGPT
jgi:uncharacterized protein YndB with AHSA1/START domain